MCVLCGCSINEHKKRTEHEIRIHWNLFASSSVQFRLISHWFPLIYTTLNSDLVWLCVRSRALRLNDEFSWHLIIVTNRYQPIWLMSQLYFDNDSRVNERKMKCVQIHSNRKLDELPKGKKIKTVEATLIGPKYEIWSNLLRTYWRCEFNSFGMLSNRLCFSKIESTWIFPY